MKIFGSIYDILEKKSTIDLGWLRFSTLSDGYPFCVLISILCSDNKYLALLNRS